MKKMFNKSNDELFSIIKKLDELDCSIEEIYENEIKDFNTLYQLYVFKCAFIKYTIQEDESLVTEITLNMYELVKKVLESNIQIFGKIENTINTMFETILDKKYIYCSSKEVMNHIFEEKEIVKIVETPGEIAHIETIFQKDALAKFSIESMEKYCSNDSEFTEYFEMKYKVLKDIRQISKDKYLKYDFRIDFYDLAYALHLGLISEDDIYRIIKIHLFVKEYLDSISKYDIIKNTKYSINDVSKIIVKKFGEELLIRVKEILSQYKNTRQKDDTTKSKIVVGLDMLVKTLVSIEEGVPEENKLENLMYLLAASKPDKDDDVNQLRKLLEGKEISDTTLLQVTFIAPNWAGIIGEYLEMKELESAVCFFISHYGVDTFKKKTVISKYMTMSIEDILYGVFDIPWFKKIYKNLGEDNFNKLRIISKNICSEYAYTKFSEKLDVVLGKTHPSSIKTAEDAIIYALVPLTSVDEMVERYTHIKKMYEERSIKEHEMYVVAINNLKLNAGYTNLNFFTLMMETRTKKLLDNYCGVTDINISEDSVYAISKKRDESIERMEIKLTAYYLKLKKLFEKSKDNNDEFINSDIQILFKNDPIANYILKEALFSTSEGILNIQEMKEKVEENDKITILKL